MIYSPLCAEHDIISVPQYAEGIYNRKNCDIIIKVYHPLRRGTDIIEKIIKNAFCLLTKDVFNWSGKRDSNSRRLPWQGNALPLSHSRRRACICKRFIDGGNNRARTYDPLLVRQMLSQLSYAPKALFYYIKFIPKKQAFFQ